MVENTPFDEKEKKADVKSHLTCTTRGLRNNELAYNICLCLMNDSLTEKELTDELYANYNSNGISIEFLAISISNCIDDLVNSELVSQITVDDEIQYQTSDSFKQLLGGA